MIVRDGAALAANPPPAARLFLFHGPDEGTAADWCRALEARLGGTRLELPPALLRDNPGRLADEAAAIALFGGTSFILVRGVGEAAAEAAALLLEAPVAGNPVALMAGDLPKTSRLRRAAEEHGQAVAIPCYAPEPRQLAVEARARARAAGLEPGAGTVEALVLASGGERGILAREIDKLACFLEARAGAAPRPLELAHIHAIGAGEGAADIDPLLAAVAGGHPAEAARALRRLAAEKVEGITLLRAAARRFAQIAEARAGIEAGAAPLAAVKAMRPPVFWKLQEMLAAEARAWPPAAIARAQARLLGAERAIKAAASPGPILAGAALLALAREAARPARA